MGVVKIWPAVMLIRESLKAPLQPQALPLFNGAKPSPLSQGCPLCKIPTTMLGTRATIQRAIAESTRLYHHIQLTNIEKHKRFKGWLEG